MRFSAPVKKHWLGSFSVLPPSGLRGFGGSRGGPEARGPRAGRGGRGDTMPGETLMLHIQVHSPSHVSLAYIYACCSRF